MIDGNLVKELRQRTGAGIMDCKNALEENEGNLDKAIEHLRKKGDGKTRRPTQFTQRPLSFRASA